MSPQIKNDEGTWAFGRILRIIGICFLIIFLILVLIATGIGVSYIYLKSKQVPVKASEVVTTVTAAESISAIEPESTDENATTGTQTVVNGEIPAAYYSLGSIPTTTRDEKVRNSGEIWIDVFWNELVCVTGSDTNAYFQEGDLKEIYTVKGGVDIGTINMFAAKEAPDKQSSVYFLNGLWAGSNCEMGWMLGEKVPTLTDMLKVLYGRFDDMFKPPNGEHKLGCVLVTANVAQGTDVLLTIKLTKEEFEKMTLDEFIQRFEK